MIQGLSNLERIADVVPFLRPFAEDDEYAAIRDVVTGYIPVLLVLGLLAVVPYVLESLALNYVRLKSHSLVQRYVLDRHFYFQLLAIFVTVLSGIARGRRQGLHRQSFVHRNTIGPVHPGRRRVLFTVIDSKGHGVDRRRGRAANSIGARAEPAAPHGAARPAF